MVRANLATSELAQGRLAEARALFAETVPLMESRLAPDDERLGVPLLNYGLVLTMLGEPAEAEPLLRRALAIERGLRDAGDVRIARAEAALGACLVERGGYEEAESLLLEARQVFADTKEVGPYPYFAARALAKLYTLTDRPAEAARFRPDS